MFFFFLAAQICFGQWQIINEGFSGRAIHFVNENTGWMAGYGTLLKTTDGGENWNSIPIDENWWIGRLAFINETVGWATGYTYINFIGTSYIWKTTDGGNNWIQQISIISNTFSFHSIYALDENNVFAAGGDRIYKTTNGGTNWLNVAPVSQGRNYFSVWFSDSQTGVIVGNYNDNASLKGIVLKTNNGGSNWDITTANEFNNIYDLQFIDNTKGYFRANYDTINYICKTEDLLLSWNIVTQHPYPINSYQYLDSNTVYAIMMDSLYLNNVMKSTDGGNSWSKKCTLNEGINYPNICFISFEDAFILAGSHYDYPILYRSNDYGESWKVEKFSNDINNVFMSTADKLILFGGWCVVGAARCRCQGDVFDLSISAKTLDVIGYSELFRFGPYYYDNNALYILATTSNSMYCEQKTKIYKSDLNGQNLITIYDSDSTVYWYVGEDISFYNETDGFVVGKYYDLISSAGGGILFTTDGGNNWDLGWKFPDTTINNVGYWYNLLSISFTPTAGWSVGESGLIVKYTPQTGWQKQISATDLRLNKVFFSDDNHGWIAGGYRDDTWNYFECIFLKTTNGGLDWNTVSNIPYLFEDLYFLDNNLGWAIGYDSNGTGGILKTTDGGNTWTIDTGDLSGKLKALHIKDNYGWAVGDNGLILRTTDVGTVWIEDEPTQPTEFILEQNYPNPFNPSTEISYQLPVGSNVILKVYDILGNEIATLVDEYKPAGRYEVEFSIYSDEGRNLPAGRQGLSSGIYFYQLKAGEYASVKKMILIK